MSRRIAREKVMQCLFSIAVGKSTLEDALPIIREEELNELDTKFAEDYARGVLEHLEELDQSYVPFLKDWQLERLANVDKTLLRMAVYEMLYLKDIPPTVTINEAVELAKVFGSEESSKFINAVLDNVKKALAEKTEEQDDEVSRD